MSVNIPGSGVWVPGDNILVNGWLKNPINQRIVTTCATQGYFIDRWTAGFIQGDTITLVDNGVKIASGSNSSAPGLIQPIEHPSRYAGKTVTLSALTNSAGGSGDISKGYISILVDNADFAFAVIQKTGLACVTATLPNDITRLGVKIAAYWNNYVVYEAVKLEPGPISTLMYDAPPDMAVEEARCRRYYEVIGGEVLKVSGYHPKTIYAVDNRSCIVLSPWKVAKRVLPTVTVNGAQFGQKVSFRCTHDGSMATGTLLAWNENSLDGYMEVEFSDIVSGFNPGKLYEATIIGDAEIY